MSLKMSIYYPPADDPEAFEKRYLQQHLPLVQKYANIKHTSFHKVARNIMGDFTHGYVFTGTWEDKEGWKADMNSAEAAAATDDAKQFATKFDVVVWEQLS